MSVEAILKRFYGPAQPGTVTGVLFTVAASKRVTVKQISLANTTVTAATVTLGVNGTAAANQFVPGVELKPNSLVVIDVTLVMEAGETLNGLQGSASAITVQCSGVEESI